MIIKLGEVSFSLNADAVLAGKFPEFPSRSFWQRQFDFGTITEEEFRFVTADEREQVTLALEHCDERLAEAASQEAMMGEDPRAETIKESTQEEVGQAFGIRWMLSIMAKIGMCEITPIRTESRA